uniref:PAP-associated domain-containing protein n=1 Tax=Anopheles atroparvus TaxID=41427 RepID=A0AAG5D2H9_ANOAO
MPNNKTSVNLCLETLDKSCASFSAHAVEAASYGELKKKGALHKVDCVIPVLNAGSAKEGEIISKSQLKPLCSKTTAHQFGTMSIMYGTSKSKKGYNNAINRKKQNQQQILNSLKSWNVQIAPSGLDKPEVELPTGIPATFMQEHGSFMHGTIAHSQSTPEPNGLPHGIKDLVAGTASNNGHETRCPETETNSAATKKRAVMESKYNKPKQKEQSEKKSSNSVHTEGVSNDKDSESMTCHEAGGVKAHTHAHSALTGIESSSRCSSEPAVVSDDKDSTTEAVTHPPFSPVAVGALKGNYHKNNHLKGRGTAAGWGWNQRQSNSGQARDFAGSKIAAGAGPGLEKVLKFTDGMPGPGNGKLKEPSNRLEHHMPNNQSFSQRESLTMHPNQQHSHQHPSYMHHPEQQHPQYMDHAHSAQQNSTGALHQYSFDFIRDVGQKMSLVDVASGSSSVNSMFRGTTQLNYNFTPQFQQQMMQHYHNSHVHHQQNHCTGQASNIQLHHVATQQQQQHQAFTHHSPGAFGGADDISCHLSPQNGGAGSGGVGGGGCAVNEPKPYPNYAVHGTAEIQNTVNSSSQNFEHQPYVYNRNGNVIHQQQQQEVNHQHPMYQSNNQQHQVHINSYHQNNNYQYHNRNVTGMRGNPLNCLVHGGGAGGHSHREEGGRNGKKSAWNGNVGKGKMGVALANGGKHFNKVQNTGYGYRRNYQHYNNHPAGGGHGQYYDYLAVSQQQQQQHQHQHQQQQQQPPVPQPHHKQQHLHRNLVYVRGYDRGHGAVLPKEYGGDIGGVTQHEAEPKGLIHSVPSSPTSKSSLDREVSPAHSQDTEHGAMAEGTFDSEGEAAPCGVDDEVVTEKQEKSVLPDEDEFELKELCNVPRSSSSSSMVSIPSTESSAISSIISQTQLLECTNASVHEYDSDSSHSSDFRDASNLYSKYGQISCGQVYRSSSSTSGISSSATNPHSNEFIPSIPSSLRASSAGLDEIIVRSHSYHGSHQNLTAYGSARSAGEPSSPIGSPTGTLRPVSGTQSVPIFEELFANNHHNHPMQLTSSLEAALRSSSSSLPASSVPPNDCQSMQSGYPKKRSQSGRTSPAASQEQYRSAAVCRGQQMAFGSNSGRKNNNQVSLSYVHRASLPTDFQYTPADRFILRAHDIELKIPPGRLSNGTTWDGLSEAIWGKFCNAQQTADKYLQKMQLWRDLYISIKQGFPKYGLYLVGSTISGFGADNSDVDMCLVSRSGPGYYDPRNEALQNLMLVKNYFMSMATSSFEQFCLIQAKVPILRFQDSKNGIEVDLNYNNCVGIRNTHLLHCYSQMDWRVRPLVLVVKLWAHHHNINDAKSMTISSYSLVLMVIHFLQYGVKPSVLPCLHSLYPEKFMKIVDINSIEMIERIEPFPTDNKETLGELLLHFLEYYKDFDYAHYAISVRMASIIPIEECRLAKSYKNDVHQWKHLCIEEPFDLTNTARSVFDGEVFEQIKCTIAASWRMLKDSKDLSVLFGDPLFTPVTSTLSITS